VALNVKAAMLICMSFIGGMSWVLQQVRMPQVELPSPVITHVARSGRAVAGEAQAASLRDERREDWVQRFARPSALAVQTPVEREATHALALADPAGGAVSELPPLALPPLVYDPPEEGTAAEGGAVVAGTTGDPSAEGAPPMVFADQVGTDGPAEGLAAALSAKRYLVAKGDTLANIARREWKSADGRLLKLLAEANPQLGRHPERLVVGQELAIPDGELARRTLAGETVRPAEAAKEAVVAQAGSGKAVAETRSVRWYTIQPKDSLRSIAKRHLNDDRRWREILDLNRMANPNRLQPGTRIKLPPTMRLASR
jgi:nucleoid-associated protein YgaU